MKYIDFPFDSRIPASGRKRRRNTRESPKEMRKLQKQIVDLKSKLDSLNDNVLNHSHIIVQSLQKINRAINTNLAGENRAVESNNGCIIM